MYDKFIILWMTHVTHQQHQNTGNLETTTYSLIRNCIQNNNTQNREYFPYHFNRVRKLRIVWFVGRNIISLANQWVIHRLIVIPCLFLALEPYVCIIYNNELERHANTRQNSQSALLPRTCLMLGFEPGIYSSSIWLLFWGTCTMQNARLVMSIIKSHTNWLLIIVSIAVWTLKIHTVIPNYL